LDSGKGEGVLEAVGVGKGIGVEVSLLKLGWKIDAKYSTFTMGCSLFARLTSSNAVSWIMVPDILFAVIIPLQL
jgi:hypothetical protein